MPLNETTLPIKERVTDFVTIDVKWFVRKNWLPLSVFVVCVVAFAVWHLDHSDKRSTDSVRWTLSAMEQALAAVAGLLLVGLTLLWSQASTARSRLRSVSRRYLDLLKGDADGDTCIEQIRRDYMQGLKRRRRALREDPFPWKHRQYPSHKEVGRGLALLSQVVADIYNVQPESLEISRLKRDLKWLGFDDDEEYMIYGEAFMVRSDESKLMEMVTELVNVGSNFVHQLKWTEGADSPSDIATRVFEWSHDDGIEESLRSVNTLKRVDVGAKIALLLFVLTFVVGMLTLLSARDGTPLWPISLSLGLGLAFLNSVVMVLNEMLPTN